MCVLLFMLQVLSDYIYFDDCLMQRKHALNRQLCILQVAVMACPDMKITEESLVVSGAMDTFVPMINACPVRRTMSYATVNATVKMGRTSGTAPPVSSCLTEIALIYLYYDFAVY